MLSMLVKLDVRVVCNFRCHLEFAIDLSWYGSFCGLAADEDFDVLGSKLRTRVHSSQNQSAA